MPVIRDVYGSDNDGRLYSSGIVREFGQNKCVTMSAGYKRLAAVQPLVVAPNECGLKKVGTILVDQEDEA